MRTSISVDEVADVSGVGVGHGSSDVMSVGHGGSGNMVSVGHGSGMNGRSGIGHSRSGVHSRGSVDNRSYLTDRVNKAILVVVFGVSLKGNVPKAPLGGNESSMGGMHGSSGSAGGQEGVQGATLGHGQNGRKA